VAENAKPIQQLFELYSENLALYIPDLKNHFCCPLCLRVFGRESLPSRGRNGSISLEHIIPGSVGGHIITLTCRQCNNQHGTDLDAHIAARFKAEDAFAGRLDEPLKGKISITSGEMSVDVYWGQDNVEMRGVAKASNPAKWMRLLSEMNVASAGTEIHLNIPLGYKAINAQLAILRMAYLLMFRQFGYGYILHPNLTEVREQINDYEADKIVSKSLISLNSRPQEYAAVTVLTVPHELRCFFVMFDLSSGIDRFIGVIMPGLDQADRSVYERWQTFSSGGSGSYRFKYIPYNPEFIRNQKEFPAFVWQNII